MGFIIPVDFSFQAESQYELMQGRKALYQYVVLRTYLIVIQSLPQKGKCINLKCDYIKSA